MENDKDNRKTRAVTYLDEHLEDQKGWYDRKATFNKTWSMRLGLLVILAGAATAVIQIWSPSPPDSPLHWSTIVTAVLGAVVVIAKSVDRLWGFDENWSNYRQAAESIKRETRLFINQAGAYTGIADEDDAYRLFVERVESVVAAEQNAFWERADSDNDK